MGVEIGHYVVVCKGGLIDGGDVGCIFYGGWEECEGHFFSLFMNLKNFEIKLCAPFATIIYIYIIRYHWTDDSCLPVEYLTHVL